MKYIVLLRAINVGGKNKILMKDFVNVLLANSHFIEVKSYLQTGNFIINSTLKNVKGITQIIQKTILEHYNYKIDVYTYTHQEFKDLIATNPFEIIEKKNYCTFTQDTYSNIDTLNNNVFNEDLFFISNGIIHTRYNTKYSDSKLNNNFYEKKLNISATTRNWNTVKKLLELSA